MRPTKRRGLWPRLGLAAVLVLAVVAYYALGGPRYVSWDYVRANRDALRAAAERHLTAALLLFFLAYVAAAALSLPIETVLSLAGGALFGRWLGTAVVDLAATCGATLAFLSSRYLFRDLVQRRFGARLEAVNRGVERDGPFYLLTLRLVPLFPFVLINLGMGLTRLRTWTFFWVSLVGMLPGCFLYVNVGAELATVQSARDIVSPGVLVSLALVGILPLAVRLLLRRRRVQ